MNSFFVQPFTKKKLYIFNLLMQVFTNVLSLIISFTTKQNNASLANSFSLKYILSRFVCDLKS